MYSNINRHDAARRFARLSSQELRARFAPIRIGTLRMLTSQDSIVTGPLFRALFEPATRQLQRTIRFLEKINKTAVLGFTRTGIIMVQTPTAAASTQSVPSWSRLSYPLLGLGDVKLTLSPESNASCLLVQVSLGLLLAVLRAIEQHAVGVVEISSDGRSMTTLSKTTFCTDASEIKAGRPGVVMHSVPLSKPLDPINALHEPTVPRPAISFHLPNPGALRERLATLSGTDLHLAANPNGTLQIEAEMSLLRTLIKWNNVRVVHSTPPDHHLDPLRLINVRVSRYLMLKVLQYTMYLPIGVVPNAICAIIPDHALVISLALADQSLHSSSIQSLMTFYIPPLG